MAPVKATRRTNPRTGVLTLDEAVVAVFIGTMNADDHVAPHEGRARTT